MNEPQICLNMIVKNESHVIERCLNSVLPYIDNWVIVDTGSTDGTQQLIRDYFARAGKPGELYERSWKNFGYNRSEALALARPKAKYSMFIDADEVFEMPSGMSLPLLTADAYHVQHCNGMTGFSFWRIQFVRNALPWRWEGVLHEAVTCEVSHRVERLSGPLTRGMFDSARNSLPQEEKYRRDAQVLEEALKSEPNNARYVFYLAQSWRDAHEPTKALEAYRRRATMQGWEEEGWYAQYQCAKQLEKLGRRAEAIEAYLTSYQRRPQRAEPLCDLARMHRETQAYHVAYLFAVRAKAIRKSDDVLFVDDSVYEWRCLDEEAVACYWIGRYAECREICNELLSGTQLPETQRARIEANRRFADERLKNL
jgi:tetratricopeptide (TPR) repeat protein